MLCTARLQEKKKKILIYSLIPSDRISIFHDSAARRLIILLGKLKDKIRYVLPRALLQVAYYNNTERILK